MSPGLTCASKGARGDACSVVSEKLYDFLTGLAAFCRCHDGTYPFACPQFTQFEVYAARCPGCFMPIGRAAIR